VAINLEFRYVIKTLWYYRSRILFILFGLFLAQGLLFSNVIWHDTSEDLILHEFNDNIDYLAATSSFSTNTVFSLMNYLDTEPLVDHYDLSVRSNMIFNAFNKNESYRYYPLSDQENNKDPVHVVQSILTSLSGMERLANVLTIDGHVPKNSDEFMISTEAKLELESVYNTSIHPGKTLNIEIGERFPETDKGEFQLKHFLPKKFANRTISGIFDQNGAESIANQAYFEGIFRKTVIFPITETNFNTTDFHQMDKYGLTLMQMISFNFQDILNLGISELDSLLFRFMERLKSRFWFVVGDVMSNAVRDLQTNYNFSFHTALLFYPLIILSLLLSYFAVGQLLNERDQQISLLRIRGANDTDIIKLFYQEYLIVGLAASLISIPVSVLFTILIPSFQDNFTFNGEIAKEFLGNLKVNYLTLIQLYLVLQFLYFLAISYHIFQKIKNEEKNQFGRSLSIAKATLTVLFTGLLIGYFVFLNIPLTPSNISNIDSSSFRIAIFYLLILWLLYSQYAADIAMKLIVYSSNLIRYVSKHLSFYVTRSVKRPKNRNKIFVFYLIFMISLLIFSGSLFTIYNNYHHESETYLQGADLRIHTTATYRNYTSTIEAIDGVDTVTPVLETTIYVGSVPYTLYVVDPDSYLSVGIWDYASGSHSPQVLLNSLKQNPENILVSKQVVNTLGFKENQSLNIFGLMGQYISIFNISGVINSAPGLGLASYPNPELSQNTRGWLMTSFSYIEKNFKSQFTRLFFGKIDENANSANIIEQVSDLDNVITVNPSPINQNFIGVFITSYLPRPLSVLVFVFLMTAFISLVMITLSINYLIIERRSEFALMLATGSTRSFAMQFLRTEISLYGVISTIVGIAFGLLTANFAMKFYIPFTIQRIFVPIRFTVSPLLIICTFLFTEVVILALLRFNKDRVIPYNIADILKEDR